MAEALEKDDLNDDDFDDLYSEIEVMAVEATKAGRDATEQVTFLLNLHTLQNQGYIPPKSSSPPQ